MAKRIVIATGNQGKVREMINAFKNLDVELISLKELPEKYPEPVEDGDSFQANSLLKAKYYCEKTGLACLADDSGLEVEVLDGAPGIYSARYAGENATDEENNAKLQSKLQDLALAGSPAAYKCALWIQMGISYLLRAAVPERFIWRLEVRMALAMILIFM